jgi:hypothetical protein
MSAWMFTINAQLAAATSAVTADKRHRPREFNICKKACNILCI